MAKLDFILTYLLLISARVKCLKIIGIFPHPGISHFHFFHPIMRGLAEAGHDVTVLSHFPDKNPVIHYKDVPLSGVPLLNDSIDLKMFENRPFYTVFREFFMLYEWGKQACELTLKSTSLATILKPQKRYDVIIMEQFNTDCMMGVAHILRAPVVALSSCALLPWHYKRFGAPLIPSYIPTVFHGFSEEMNFMQRSVNWFTTHVFQFLYQYYSENVATEILRKKFGKDMPEVGALARETSVMLVNQHFSLSGPKPLPPSIVEVGGVHIQKAKTLDLDLQRLLDGAEHGAIYISWGSMIRAESLPADKREAILRAMGRLKQTVLWKWENETVPKQPGNVHVRKWMPQREILCHPNVKVFLGHGGLLGSTEAAYCGVPVVLTPMYGDQFLNSAALKHRGMGIILNYEDITESAVFKAVKKALEPSYQESAKTISYSFKHRPQKALETAIWWIEYVAKTEGAALTKSTSTYYSKFVYYSLDVYTFIVSIVVFSLGSWIILVRHFCRRSPVTVKVKHH